MGINFNPTFYDVFTTGLALRLGMLLYGLWMDTHFAVKYTDIDYHVFTDAARYVFDGHSPYLRSTYRYTPLLAWALTPNVWLNPSFGKLLFIAFDCVVGYLIHRILIMRGVAAKQSTMLAALWMLNPQVANISSRGSAESMIGAATLLSFYCLMKKQLGTSAVIFGLAVHLKLYPIIYALPLLVVLDKPVFEPRPPRSSSPPCSGSIIERLVGWSNIYRVKFAIISASTFFALNLLMFYIYGYEFLDETYLYHVVRKDHRHNFSIWFLPIYLNLQNQSDSLIGLASFVPQLLVVAVLGVKFGKDLFFAAFIQTFAFVTYNKVCTAQYFMWYCCFVPLILPFTRINLRWTGAALIAAWIVPQALWLRNAYQLEFLGANTFVELWVSSIIMFIANNAVVVTLVRKQRRCPLFDLINGRVANTLASGHEKTA